MKKLALVVRELVDTAETLRSAQRDLEALTGIAALAIADTDATSLDSATRNAVTRVVELAARINIALEGALCDLRSAR